MLLTSNIQLRRRSALPWILGLCLFGASGCARQLHLHTVAGLCVNPPDRYCDAYGDNSRLLEVRVYQLKDYVDPTTLKWEELLEPDQDFTLLKAYLTDPAKPTMVKSAFSINHLQVNDLQIPRLRDTKYLLVVAAGRHPGEHSIEIVPVGRLQRTTHLTIDRYDLFFPPNGRRPLADERTAGGRP